MMPLGVLLLLGLGTLALVVRRHANLTAERVDAHIVGYLLGGLVLVGFAFAAVLLVYGFSQLDVEGRPPQARKGNLVVGIICAAVVAAGILYFMWRPPHAVESALDNVQSGVGQAAPRPTLTLHPTAEPSGNGQGGGFTDVVSTVVMASILVTVIAAVGIGIVIAVRALRHREVPIEVGPDRDTDLAAAVDAARAATFADTTPRAVIIGCYETFERELARSGVIRGAAETSATVLDEAVATGVLDADAAGAATDLVQMFELARFSPHPVTTSHVEAARADLDRIRQALVRRAARDRMAPAAASTRAGES